MARPLPGMVKYESEEEEEEKEEPATEKRTEYRHWTPARLLLALPREIIWGQGYRNSEENKR